MKPSHLALFFILVLFISQGCNTLYNTQVVNLEILEPSKVKLPYNYSKVAVRYNNCNVALNPYFQKSYYIDKSISHKDNVDSIAAEVYFEQFLTELGKQCFFDSVIELEAKDYSKIRIIDTLNYKFPTNIDSAIQNEELREKINVNLLSQTIHEYENNTDDYNSNQYLHPRLGLYQAEDLRNIADSTEADILISLDYFSSIDGISSDFYKSMANEVVITQGYWNFYDLHKTRFHFSINRKDTVMWDTQITHLSEIKRMLPPYKDAILNAADISGTNFVNYLIPHWIEVQRIYYGTGHIELKQTNDFIKNGNWAEAAKMWKTYATNSNKSISAKCKFNMGLYCEMEGNLDAAIEWVVESYYVFEQKNEQHYLNCMEYIRILSQRKQDILLIENQLGLKENLH